MNIIPDSKFYNVTGSNPRNLIQQIERIICLTSALFARRQAPGILVSQDHTRRRTGTKTSPVRDILHNCAEADSQEVASGLAATTTPL
mmetsp:Transcript_7976/g.14385  ORF Transcript_7976/g.14385 Transcript_7976/m.14385 type:complete len:88 (+) Transcript_7976:3-266(+)